jgi:hypothetical protein
MTYRIYAIVEGQTEQAAFREVITPYLANRGISFSSVLVGKPSKKGGNCCWARVLANICKLLRQENETYITTFFDYYALPNDWLNWQKSKEATLYTEKAEILEKGMKQSLLEKMPTLNPARFIPYIQMYEFEALLFSDTEVMEKVLNVEGKHLQKIVDDFGGNCETINDSPVTAPSKRLGQIVPSYKKGSSTNAHGWQIIKQIGIEKIRKKCQRFNAWLKQLENIRQK